MSLFPRLSSSFYSPLENDFRSLFRLMDNVSSRYENSMPTTTSIRAFAPRFDVEEKDDAYHLHGELPGIDQKDIEIEFADAHTLVVKGGTKSHSERYGGSGDTNSQEPKQIDSAAESGSVENKSQPAGEPGTAVTTTSNDKEITDMGNSGSKWWVSERTAGEFYRSFSFPSRVDQDEVKASLSKGILSILVPKMTQKKGGKKVTIEQVE